MSYPVEVLKDSPAFFLRFGEPSGTNANDETANNNDGTYVNTPTLGVVPGPLANDPAFPVVTLNGTDESITIADHATMDWGDVFTVDAWVKRATTGAVGQTIYIKGNLSILFQIESDRLRLTRYLSSHLVDSTVTLTDTLSWHHVAVTKTGATVKLYLDGVDVTGTVTNDTMSDTSAGAEIGGNVGSGMWNGSLANVAGYPTALSATRIFAHYAAARLGVRPDYSLFPKAKLRRAA